MDGLTTGQSSALADLFAVFRRNGTWFCPCLTDTPRPVPILSTDPRLRYFTPSQRKTWSQNGSIPPERSQQAQRNYRNMLTFVPALHKAGIGLLAGSDPRQEFGIPGFWLHEELTQLVAAGLSPMDALRTATYKPAQFLGLLDSLGTIEPRKLAEMVLLDANPLRDISNTAKINTVFTGGRMYGRRALDDILRGVEAHAKA
jgi:hypothetical protein